MKKIRIGNDIVMKWRITINGEEVNLEGLDLSLYISTTYQPRKAIAFTVAGNEITATYKGTEQKVTGVYRLTLYRNEGENSQSILDACDAFELVSCSCLTVDAAFGGAEVELPIADLGIGVPGLSAYEIAVAEGFKGTQAEWIASLSAASEAAAAECRKFTDEAKISEKERQDKEALRVTAEDERAVSETARQSAEADRATNERNRVTAESQRVTNETARSNAESSRATAETARQEAETARQTAEQGRVTAEQQRADAEAARAKEFATFEGKIAAKEDTANKVASLDNPSDVTFPTSKAVFNKFEKLDSYDITSSLVMINNKYIDSRNGELIAENGAVACDYMPVEAGKIIKVSVFHYDTGQTYFKGYAWYDANKAYISGGRYTTAETKGNIYEYLTAPSNAAYIRVSFWADEETYGKISFIHTSGRVDKLDNLTQELSKADQSIRQELSKQTGSLVANTVSSTIIEDYSDTLYKFIVENIPNVGKDCEAVLAKAIPYSEHVYMYDKFGQLIGCLTYINPRASFTLLANTSRVEFIVRKNYYTLESTISFTYTTSAKDTFYDTQLLDKLYVNADGANKYYASNKVVIARMKVDGGKKYAFKTNIDFPTTIGVPRNTAFYDAEGNLLGVSPVEKFKYIEDYYSYKFETPENADYIYTSVSGETYTIADITTCELVEIKDLNERKVMKPLSVWVLGDSLSATGYNRDVEPLEFIGAIGGWISEFLKRVNIRPIKWYNNAIGGATLTDTSEDFSQNSFIRQTNSLIEKYNNGEISAPDVLIVSGCTNDLGATPKRAITQEEIESSPYSTYEEYVERNFFEVGGDYYHLSLNQLSEINKGKIIGAIRYIVETVGNLFPKCKYLICTPPQTSRKAYLNEWECVRDMKYAAMRLCIPVADVWGEAQMPMLWDYNDDWTAAGSELSHRFLDDGIHTYDSGKGSNCFGYKRQGEYVARKFSEHFINDMIIYEDDERQ